MAAIVLSFGLLSCSKDEDENELEPEQEIQDDNNSNGQDDNQKGGHPTNPNGGNSNDVYFMLAEPHPMQLTPSQTAFMKNNNQFTLNFLRTVNMADRSNNSYIYSPLSITYVLGMVNDAATGQTEQELEQALGFSEGGIQAVNEYCKNLIDNLPKVDEYVQLDIANAIFLNKDYTLKEQFKSDMLQYFDAKAEALDFSSPQTLGHINGWCNEKTRGMIPTILEEVNPYMVSYLLNAIYFKADWTSKFDEKNTKNEAFATGTGTTQLPLMQQNVLIQYLNNGICSAVVIPYGTGLWNMTVMLPEEGKTTDDIINLLATAGIDGLEGTFCVENSEMAAMKEVRFAPYEVELKLPRFNTASDTNDLGIGGLIDLLRQMGIRLVFDSNNAEIPNMANVPVYINMMRQKAAIDVNEEGAKASAVTVAGMKVTGLPEMFPKATFHANRPFVYVIREQSSGVILFVGKFTGMS